MKAVLGRFVLAVLLLHCAASHAQVVNTSKEDSISADVASSVSVLSLSHTASEAEPEAEAGPPPSQLRAELEGVEPFITGPGVEGVKPGISTVFMKQNLIDAACARAPSFAALASFSDQDLEEVIRGSGAKGIASLRFRRIIRFA